MQVAAIMLQSIQQRLNTALLVHFALHCTVCIAYLLCAMDSVVQAFQSLANSLCVKKHVSLSMNSNYYCRMKAFPIKAYKNPSICPGAWFLCCSLTNFPPVGSKRELVGARGFVRRKPTKHNHKVL